MERRQSGSSGKVCKHVLLLMTALVSISGCAVNPAIKAPSEQEYGPPRQGLASLNSGTGTQPSAVPTSESVREETIGTAESPRIALASGINPSDDETRDRGLSEFTATGFSRGRPGRQCEPCKSPEA